MVQINQETGSQEAHDKVVEDQMQQMIHLLDILFLDEVVSILYSSEYNEYYQRDKRNHDTEYPNIIHRV